MNRRLSPLAALSVAALALPACTVAPVKTTVEQLCNTAATPRYIVEPHVFLQGGGITNQDCRDGAPCQHNENTDLFRFQGAIYLVHRTAESQLLGPNSALFVYRSTDEGASFTRVAVIPAVNDRDIRDPAFYELNGQLFLKAITRVRGFTAKDQDVNTISVAFQSPDGVNWTYKGSIGPTGWGFWRVVALHGTLYSAAYQDGDLQVVLYSSTDGVTWVAGPQIYGVAADTPLETELVITPEERMLAIVRMDGNEDELLGDKGRLRTKLCWASMPFQSFDCPYEITGARLDGAAHFWQNGRLFVVARKHLPTALRKRTDLYELTGDVEHGPLDAVDWGELPSAGDTGYAGVVGLHDGRTLMSWYSGDFTADLPWTASMLSGTDIWLATFDPAKMPLTPPTDQTCPNSRDNAPVPTGSGDCHSVVSDPLSVCGFPCDKGNTLGVGAYCTTAGGECASNSAATTCSDALNGALIVKSYICTLVCDPTTDCGPGASCKCPLMKDGGQICGCIPDACVLPAGTFGVGP